MRSKIAVTLSIIMTGIFVSFAMASAVDRFTDNEDGTVTDHLLEVMWSKEDNHGDIDWKQADQWVKYTFPFRLAPEKRDDWRLPTIEELKSLYVEDESYQGYETNCGHWVKIVPEIKLTCGWLWTSEKKSITARIFNFKRGFHYTDRMVHKRGYRVLPVRSLRSGE